MLTERYAAMLDAHLVPRGGFLPFPPASDRAAWDALPPAVRAEVIGIGEGRAGQAWPALPATLFMEYRRTGDRAGYERAHFERRAALAELVVAACAEGTGRFVDQILDGIWAICEESFWGVPAHNDAPDAPPDPLPDSARPYVDLFAAETGALLAWTHHLLGRRIAEVSPRAEARVRAEVERRVVAPFLDREDFWWMGLRGGRVNNWNPWCVSNCLAAGLLCEPRADRRAAVVRKAMRCLDRYLEGHPGDGGCDEGTSYWDRAGGSLFDCLELLRAATGGWIDLYAEPLVRDIGRFLYREHIDGEWFVDFADGPARVHVSADLVHRFGLAIGDPDMAALGAAAHRHGRAGGARLRGTLPRLLPALWHFEELEEAARTAAFPYVRDVWLPEIQVMAARERGGSPGGLYVAAKGGHNGESHNHNDVGQFLVYLDGRPVLVDAGVGVYTAQTFSARRYEVWTMRSTYHNLPSVGGVEQAAGEAFRARDVVRRVERAGPGDAVDQSLAELSLDIARAYPREAGIEAWRRTVRLHRGPQPRVEVLDDFQLARPSGDVRLHLLLAGEPRLTDAGRLEVEAPAGAGAPEAPDGPRAAIRFDPAALTAVVEPLPLEDARLRGVWGHRLWRVVLRAPGEVVSGAWRLTVQRAGTG